MKSTKQVLAIATVFAFGIGACSPRKPPPDPGPSSVPAEPDISAPPSTPAVAPSPQTSAPLELQAFVIPDLGVEMVPIVAGRFMMGSSEDEAALVGDVVMSDDEGRHSVEITKPFWMSKLEITQKQWLSITGVGIQDQFDKMLFSDEKLLQFGISWVTFKDYFFLANDLINDPGEAEALLLIYRQGISSTSDPSLPMACVSYTEAMQFCKLLTESERSAGRLPAGYCYTIPTEAQWEYACRAGTVSAYAGDVVEMDVYCKSGNLIPPSGNSNHLYPRGRGNASRSRGNKWGLVDMHGNLAEWCLDWYGPYPVGKDVAKDPVGPRGGEGRVIRGGSFLSTPAECRSAFRSYAKPEARTIEIGFRVVLSPSR